MTVQGQAVIKGVQGRVSSFRSDETLNIWVGCKDETLDVKRIQPPPLLMIITVLSQYKVLVSNLNVSTVIQWIYAILLLFFLNPF